MASRVLSVLLLSGAVMALVSYSGLAEEADKSASGASTAREAVAREWVMGIVKSVNLEKGTIDVSYYDFENDEDKVITISTNDKTEYIGLKLKDINPGDDVEVSYTYSNDGTPVAEAVITAKLKDIEKDNSEKSEEKK